MLYNGDVKKWWGGLIVVLAVISIYTGYTILRPVSYIVTEQPLAVPQSRDLTALRLGLARAAVGYIDPNTGISQCRALGTGDNYTVPRATASLAKMITVQVVLDKYPLAEGESGPTITMSSDDEARYWQAVYNGGSNARIVTGELITERQLIEGILLASANNIADSLAIWAYGSMDAYHQAAREWLNRHNLTSTVVGDDASGFSASTKSTPFDLCNIMLLAVQQPALAEILSETSAIMPTGETLVSTNRLLGVDGIFAGKTGYTDEAGRGVMVASRQTIDNVDITVAAVSLSNDSYDAAFTTAQQLIQTIPNDVDILSLQPNQSFGVISSPWREQSRIISERAIAIPYWADQPPRIHLSIADNLPAGSIANGTIVGTLNINSYHYNLVADSAIRPPNLLWRLSHPY